MAELRQYEANEVLKESEWQSKLVLFRESPYEYCKAVLEQMSKTDLLDLALVRLLESFDTDAAANHRPNRCAEKDLLAAVEQAVWEIEL
jgi:hypothetical protein